MSISKQGSGYALELVVGIQDSFGNQSKEIRQEAQRLEKDIKDLQKVTKDISAFEKSKKELEKLEKQSIANEKAIKKHKDEVKRLQKTEGDTAAYDKANQALKRLEKQDRANTQSMREHERAIRRLSKNLNDAGVDIRNLADDERKLQQQIAKTNQELNNQTTNMKKLGSMSDGMGKLAGGVAAGTALIYKGNDTNRNERLLAARTGTNLSTIQSEQSRAFRSELTRKYGVSSSEVMSIQESAMQQGFSNKDMQALATAGAQMQAIYGGDPLEAMRAIANTSKSFNIPISQAAGQIMSVRQQAGDANGDLYDTFAEYAPVINEMFSSGDFARALTASRRAGVWNYDAVGDSFKEMRVRFSDASEFAKLVGQGKTAGTLDNIKDPTLRKSLTDRSYQLRNAFLTGGDTQGATANLIKSLGPLLNQDPGQAKQILESIGGVRFSEDIGVKGLRAIIDSYNNPGKYKTNADVGALAESTLTPIDKSIAAANTLQNQVNNATSDVVNSMEGLANSISNTTKAMTDTFGGQAVGTVGAGLSLAAGVGAGGLLSKLGKYGLGRLGKLGGLGALGSLGGFGGLGKMADAVGTGGSLIPKWAPKMPGFLKGGLKGFKKVPILGAGLSALSIAGDIASGDDRGLWGDVGSSIGGFLGGAAGSFLMPGAGTIGGGVAGSMLGDQIGQWAYNLFNGDDDVKKVENQVVNGSGPPSAIAAPPIAFNPTIQITVQSAPEDQVQAITDSVVAAMRNMTPELAQAFKNALGDIYADQYSVMDQQ